MLNYFENEFNKTVTANGAFAYKSTKSAVLDLFALGSAYREHLDEDVTKLFSKAFAEDQLLAMRTLFYLRDIRGGQGERRFFRLCLKHLARHHKDVLLKNLHLVPEYGRWDDLWVLLDTPLKNEVIKLVKLQLEKDLNTENPSLLAKWLPSNNTSSSQTRTYAKVIQEGLGYSPRRYRKTLSTLRKQINIVERKMSDNEWNKIEYDKLPSKAGLIYRNAFLRHDEERYQEFLESLNKGGKVNSSTLYPYEIVGKVLRKFYHTNGLSQEEIALLESMWNNLPNYIGDRKENSIAVVDVSGSMQGRPIEVAISLGIYLAERNKGIFHNHFFTFSNNPQFVKIQGVNIVEKVRNINRSEWGWSTNVESVFRTILEIAVENDVSQEDMIDKLYIITDGQFNEMTRNAEAHIFNELAKDYAEYGYKLPQLVFWNVNAFMTNVPFTMNDSGVVLVSGFSPSIFKHLMKGEFVDPYTLMLEVINSERYMRVTV